MDDIDDNLPESVDDLRKIQLLGSGSYGIVYLVQDLNTKQYYALKEVPKSRTVSDEVKILTAIKHPLVVCTHKVFEDEAHLYLLMEWVEGGELWHHLHNHPGGHFTQDAAVFYAAEIIIVLEYLQSLNIVYRDLKPENILISKTGHIKLVDFGFAKYIPEGRATSFVGSPEFLAPEVIRGKPYGYAADLWSLGVVIYEMISGIAPFRDDDVMKLYRRIVDAKVGFTDHFDKHGKDLVQQLLVKDPERRIGNRAKGIIELKMHPWFRGCPWDTSVMTPPIIPVLHNASDTSYFAYNQHHGVSSSINYGPIRVTLSKLIEKATKEESIASHPTIIEDLALTCWCYTTPPILLQELVLRYASQPTPTEKKKINYKKQKHFKRERIVTILQTWIPYLLKNEYEETFNVSKKVYTILYTSPTASPTITADSTSDNTLVRTSSKKKSPKITPQNPPTSLQSTHTSSETTTPLSMLITKGTGNRGKPANSPFAFTKKESDADSLANVADKTVSLKDLLVLFIEYIGKRTPNTGLLELLQTCDAKAVTLPIPRLAQGANMPVGSSVRSMSAESLIVERSQSPTMTRPPSSRGSSSEKFEFLRIPIDEIVSQIMECDINLFSKVGIRELVDGKTHEGSNVSKMISNFNWTSRWIVTQILQQDKPAIRASVISNFITSAITFSENGDFNALMVVVSALNSAAIYRLRTTWSLVPPNLVSELTMLERMMRSTNNYASYREKLALLYFQRKPVVPYFAAYLSDIRYCRATFAATIFEGLMVNMDFVHEMGAKLRELLNFQSTLQTYMSQHHFPFQKERKNASNYVNLYTMRALPDGELYTISELREETTADNTTTTTNNANVSQKMEMREVTRRLTDLGMSKNQTPPQKMKGRDWQTVFTYATKAKYDANFTILAEGEPVDAFYRVLSGKVILQKVGMDGSVKIIGSVSPGGIFGEVSLLDDKKNHLSWGSAVTAEETEVAVLTDTFILKLLNSEAELAGRFLKFLASGIASRLRTASAVVPLKTEGSGAVATNLAQDSKQNINDKLEDMEEEISMDKLFGLKNELPLKVYATKVGILSGIMVVTKQHICSFTKAFGLKQKMVIPIAEVTDEIRPKGKDTLIITYNKKTRRFSFRENLLPEVVDMLNSIRQASKSGAEVVNRAARRATEDITYGNSELRFNLELVLGKENRVPESVQFDTSEVLTDKDWALLLKGAHVSSFAPGTVLIQEGDTPQQLFQIVKGSVTVEKDIPNSEKRVVIARRTVGEIFGEISFLDDEGQSGGASASVVAETNVELYILSEQFVNVLLSVYTELAPKFYKYLACLMQNRIYELAPIKPALGPITSKNTNTNTP